MPDDQIRRTPWKIYTDFRYRAKLAVRAGVRRLLIKGAVLTVHLRAFFARVIRLILRSHRLFFDAIVGAEAAIERAKTEARSRDFFTRITGWITGQFLLPYWLALSAIEGAEIKAGAQNQAHALQSARYWLIRQVLRLAHWAVFWTIAGPVWLTILIIYLLLFFFFILKPWEYTQWVGASWVAAIITRATLASIRNFWSQAFSRICLYVAIGITPQFLFLILYNGYRDVEVTPPVLIEHLIDSYEFFAVSLYKLFQPIKEVGWQWWALSAIGLLSISFLFQRPGFLSNVLQLRKVLAAVIFIVSITVAVSLSTANWQPDLQVRLKANLQTMIQNETVINLSQDLIDWFNSHPGIQTALPEYVRNIENAITETKKDPSGHRITDDDIAVGQEATIKALVAQDIGSVLTKDLPSTHSSQQELPGSVRNLLRLDDYMKKQNHTLKLQADQFRTTATAVIAQVVDVPVSSVPLLKEIIGEMINNAAELLSERIVERLPIERVIATSGKIFDVGQTIKGNIEAIFDNIFGVTAHVNPTLNRMQPEDVEDRMKEEIRRATEVRLGPEEPRTFWEHARRVWERAPRVRVP